MYTEMFNFRPQSWKAASKPKPHRGLGTRLPSWWQWSRDSLDLRSLSLKSLYIYNDIIFNLTIWSLKRVLHCLWKSGTIPIFVVVPIISEHRCRCHQLHYSDHVALQFNKMVSVVALTSWILCCFSSLISKCFFVCGESSIQELLEYRYSGLRQTNYQDIKGKRKE